MLRVWDWLKKSLAVRESLLTLEQTLLHGASTVAPGLAEEAEDGLLGLGLAGTRLARDDHRLTLATSLHVSVRLVSCNFPSLLPTS